MQATVGAQLGIPNGEEERTHPALVTPDRLGIEVELEGFTEDDITLAKRHLSPLWTAKGDGSLRNGGVEFITNGGLGGQRLYSAFEALTHLLANTVEFQDTFRCSTHMHINMLDFTVPQVAKFLMVYAACEPVLFAHCGLYRRSSNFCVPVGDSLPFHKNLVSVLYDDAVKSRYAGRYSNKYTAMNLQPLFGTDRDRALGTVEFRGGRPMTNIEEFTLQANLLLSIKQFVRQGPEDAEQLLRTLGDTVMDSVYANGCAAGLQPPQQEMDDAMVTAWTLLKSYQEGMKNPQTKVSAAGIGRPIWDRDFGDSSTTRPELTVAELDLNTWWNTALSLNNQLPTPYPRGYRFGGMDNPYPGVWRKFDNYIDQFRETAYDTRGFQQLAAITLGDRGLGRAVLDVSQVHALMAAWVLTGRRERWEQVMIAAVCARVQRGAPQCLVQGIPYNQSPKVIFDNTLAGLDWTEEPVAWDLLTNYFELASPWVIFQQLVGSRVRLKNRNALQDALSSHIEASVPRIRSEMYTTELFHIFRIAQVNPVDHLFRSDVPEYDRIAMAMTFMYAHSMAVPVRTSPHQDGWINHQFGSVRITNHSNSHIGWMVSHDSYGPHGYIDRRPDRVTSTFANIK